MNMIRHKNRGDHCPIPGAAYQISERCKCIIVRKHRTPVLHAEGDEINHSLIITEKDRDPRWVSHAATFSASTIVGQALTRASPKRSAAILAVLTVYLFSPYRSVFPLADDHGREESLPYNSAIPLL